MIEQKKLRKPTRCVVCQGFTKKGKPWCSDHVTQSAYALSIERQLADREAERARLVAGGRPDLSGSVARDLLALASWNAETGRAASELALDREAVKRVLNAADVAWEQSARGFPVADSSQALKALVDMVTAEQEARDLAEAHEQAARHHQANRREAMETPKDKARERAPEVEGLVLTTEEIAQELEVSESSLYNWKRQGCPQHYTSKGGGIPSLWVLEDVKAWRAARVASRKTKRRRRSAEAAGLPVDAGPEPAGRQPEDPEGEHVFEAFEDAEPAGVRFALRHAVASVLRAVASRVRELADRIA